MVASFRAVAIAFLQMASSAGSTQPMSLRGGGKSPRSTLKSTRHVLVDKGRFACEQTVEGCARL